MAGPFWAPGGPLPPGGLPGGAGRPGPAHGGPRGGGRPGEYGPISREDIARSGLDYLALGHIHQASGLQREGNTFWAYPGCPEGRGFDELGDKGVLYVGGGARELPGGVRPLCRRRYQILSVDVTGAEDLAAAVRAALPPDTAGDIYRILLTGERGAEALDLEGLTRALAPRFYGLTLRDRTRVQRAVWDRMEGGHPHRAVPAPDGRPVPGRAGE